MTGCSKNTTLNTFVSWLIVLVVSVFALYFVYQRGQDNNWDLANYHFFSGYSLIHGRFLSDISPINIQSFQNPLSNVIAYLALSKLAFPVSVWSLTFFQLLSLPILVLIVRQIGRDLDYNSAGLTEFLALTLCLLSPLWWSELGTTFSNSTLSFFVLLGLYLGLRDISGSGESKYSLVWSGVFFGLAAGIKLTNAEFLIGFGIALITVNLNYSIALQSRVWVKYFVGTLLGFGLTAWWNIYLWANWKSPLFPFYNALLKSPYFDFVNWRDDRWRFSSVGDFAEYLWTAGVSPQTAEIPFVDLRLLICFVIGLLVLLVKKSDNSFGRTTLAFLVFFLGSLGIWALVFSYQRYLIPIELLIGLFIWIVFLRLTGDKRRVTLLLAISVVVCWSSMKIPDWGHTQPSNVRGNPFGVSLPATFRDTPGRYLVLGVPLGYLLPSLHPGSKFYGLGVSTQIDQLIKKTVLEDKTIPLRILSNEIDILRVPMLLDDLGFPQDESNLTCYNGLSSVAGYVVCEVESRNETVEGNSPRAGHIDIDFQGLFSVMPSSVIGVKGLGIREPYGRWSIDDVVEVRFANCLPAGRLEVSMRGQAFRPNIGKTAYIMIGNNRSEIVFEEKMTDKTVFIDNNDSCATSLSLLIPDKASPESLGLGPDARNLGIKLMKLNISSPSDNKN